MVRRTNYSKRFAFTMIELIFAIVIIAISVVSLPMMTQATQKGIESNILQEAIFAASAELMGATAGYWDERSMLDTNLSDMSRVINISGNCNSTTKLKPGHINQPKHRRCIEDTTIIAAHNQNTALPGVNVFDLNDAGHSSDNIFVDTTKNQAGYKDTYTSTVSVALNNNVKTITVTVSNSDRIVTVLRTQSANIGEIDYYKRTF
ncbi:MAG: type II secretion system protein [Sulfurimonas sp.]|nr:type II secretion system protein [Sulfurimonas sp.]